MNDLDDLSQDFENALLSVDRKEAKAVLTRGRERYAFAELAEHVISTAFERIGKAWDAGDVALSQVYVSGRIAEDVVGEISLPSDRSRSGQPKIAIALLDDYHMLGKRMVYTVVQASGFSILDFGRIEVDELFEKVKDEKIRILLISTLMLRSALQIKKLSDLLKEAGLGVKVVVGGAPFRFDAELWREVGADAMGFDAADAIRLTTEMMDEAS
ncbi:MAG: cobalamin-dependent protein [Alphaproteobacteria bacterium]|nr:cobalamin-dependent protein [Alphaproteobacteria bacterium]MDP6622897.1 cobalamin-dependent protein [Alphaproteobacteria bacterium]